MNAELEILGVKLKHYRVDAAMEIAEEYLSNDKLNTIGIVPEFLGQIISRGDVGCIHSHDDVTRRQAG